MTFVEFSSADPDRQALAVEFIEHVEHAVFPPIMGAVLDEIVGPDVVGMFRLQPNAESVGQPYGSELLAPLRASEIVQ